MTQKKSSKRKPSQKPETYKYRAGLNFNVKAEVAGPELNRIWKANGEKLTPPDVVTAARPEKAPLHPAFEWRDPVAAEQWRLFQARNLMRSVVVQREDREQSMFVHVSVQREEQRERFYQNTEVIVQRPDEYASAKAEARKALIECERRYRALVELADTGERTDEEKTKIQIIWESIKTATSVAQTLQ